MKLTYRIDPQGRVMIPMHIKKQLGLMPGTLVTIEADGRSVKIKKAQETCVICGKNIPCGAAVKRTVGGNTICADCAEKEK